MLKREYALKRIEKLKISYDEFAEKVKVHPRTARKFLDGDQGHILPASSWLKIAKALEMNVEDFLKYESNYQNIRNNFLKTGKDNKQK